MYVALRNFADREDPATRMSAHRIGPVPRALRRPRFWPPAAFWRALGSHILIPLFLAAGMAITYLGAFHQPQPHDLPIAIVGQGPAAEVFAQTMNDRAPSELDVTTVATAAAAKTDVRDQKLAAAYQAGPSTATIYLSTAASTAQASAAEEIFLPIAYQQHLPVTIEDVRALEDEELDRYGPFA